MVEKLHCLFRKRNISPFHWTYLLFYASPCLNSQPQDLPSTNAFYYTLPPLTGQNCNLRSDLHWGSCGLTNKAVPSTVINVPIILCRLLVMPYMTNCSSPFNQVSEFRAHRISALNKREDIFSYCFSEGK